jgi:hypothetical protein
VIDSNPSSRRQDIEGLFRRRADCIVGKNVNICGIKTVDDSNVVKKSVFFDKLRNNISYHIILNLCDSEAGYAYLRKLCRRCEMVHEMLDFFLR